MEVRRIRFPFVKIIVILLILSLGKLTAVAEDTQSIRFFYSDDCVSCHEVKAFLDLLIEHNPTLVIEQFEIIDSNDIWESTCAELGIPAWGVPRFVIGSLSFVGYSVQDGPLQYLPSYYGFWGFKNQILAAIEEMYGYPITFPFQSEVPSVSPLPALDIADCALGCS